MHYYQFNPKEHALASYHLNNEEDLAFRRLKDMYHETEKPISLDIDSVARRLRLETQWVLNVLKDFFFQAEDGWHIAEIDAEIARYQSNAAKNKANGAKGGRPKREKEPDGNPMGYESQPIGNPKPLTINQQPDKEKYVKRKAAKPAASDDATAKRGCRLPKDWTLSNELQVWTEGEHPSINLRGVFERFCDYWDSKPGKDGVKLDWDKTWRNWVRRDKEFHDAKSKPKAPSGVAAQIGAYLQ